MENLRPEIGAEATGIETEKINIVNAIRQDMESRRLVPIQMIQQGGLIDFVKSRATETELNGNPYTGEDARLEELLETSKRPFCIIFAAHPDKGDVVFKARTKEDPRKSAENEINFLNDVAPVLMSLMSENGRLAANKIMFPTLLDAKKGEPPTICLENFIEGNLVGSIHRADPNVISEEDVAEIVAFIRFFQNELSTEKIKQISPESEFPTLHVFDNYAGVLERRRQVLEPVIGKDMIDHMQLFLTENEETIRNYGSVFGSCDINPANIIKTQTNQLALIDWERAGFTDNSAQEYGFLFVSLWSNPRLQEMFLHEACKMNADDPEFMEKFRIDFLYNRGSGELYFWKKALDVAADEGERAMCLEAIERLSQLLQDAVNKKGIWSEDNEPQDNKGKNDEPVNF